MAIKYKLISELYDRTCNTVVANPQSWQKYLDSACRNYKLRFDEQLLIFAQRPDATAVLEIERWNTSFGRWVNKERKVLRYLRTLTEAVKGLFTILTYRIPTKADIPVRSLFGK